MTRDAEIPADIPADVWRAADEALDLMLCNCIEASGSTEQLRIDSTEPLARALLAERLAERERAAQIAERDADWTAFARQSKRDWKGDETNAFAAADDCHLPTPANVFAYTTGIAAGRAIASAIRSPSK